MGGGAAMRAAAKGVAGIGAVTAGIRSTGSLENPVSVTVRPALSGLSAPGLTVDQPVQKSVWEIDEWELAGGGSDDDFVVDRNSNSGRPRLVFGPVPTFEETKEATTELKDALDKVYLSSPKSAGSVESLSSLHETKACITHESSVPKSAMQAFKLLKESPAAQTVVASIACDPNVWNAVMQNPLMVEYLESEKNANIFGAPENQESSNSSVDSDDDESKKPDALMAFLENVKVAVVDMVQNLTNMVQSWFTVSEADKTAKSPDGSPTDGIPKGIFAGGSFMALAMMVIMVVAVKRA